MRESHHPLRLGSTCLDCGLVQHFIAFKVIPMVNCACTLDITHRRDFKLHINTHYQLITIVEEGDRKRRRVRLVSVGKVYVVWIRAYKLFIK